MKEVSVLVVQNNDDVYGNIKKCLQGFGIVKISQIRDGFYAISEIISQKPTMVIAEMYMSTPNGNDLCAMLKHRKVFQDIAVVITANEESISDVIHIIQSEGPLVGLYDDEGYVLLETAVKDLLEISPKGSKENITNASSENGPKSDLKGDLENNREMDTLNKKVAETATEETENESSSEGSVPFTLKRKQQEAV